jgi:hypothetical protein
MRADRIGSNWRKHLMNGIIPEEANGGRMEPKRGR